MRRSGSSVVEVIISLGLAAVFVASIGNALGGIKKLNAASLGRDRAVAFARQAVETITAIAPSAFGCHIAGGGSCTLNGQPHSCQTLPGYESCWAEFPRDNGVSYLPLTNLHLVSAGGWHLSTDPTEETTAQPDLARTIDFVNLPDPAGANHFNLKQATVTVTWTENGQSRSISVQTVLSGWKNI